ncbi:MAG: exo-alpha-sialidase [Gaiellaceae bacterium]
MGVLLLVGTRKGLFLLRGDEARRDWQLEGPLLTGWSVYHAILDPRDGTMYAAANNWVYGATVQRSRDVGKTWERSEQLGLPEESGLKLEAAWHVEPGHESQPNTLWLGGDPGVLFRSDDGGAVWEPVKGILEHPTRDRWNPGAGGLCCHSIQLDPEEARRMYVAISAAGAFRTDDGGKTWAPANRGVAADFLPDPEAEHEVGQCVHKLLLHPQRPERLWQQNHCGVYRSDNRGDSWERLDGNGLPSGFGFGLALHPRRPDTAFVIPEEGAENRVTSDGRLGVYRTDDGGASWSLASNGLPEPAWSAVLREGMSSDDLDPTGVYFGTQGGSVFASPSEGADWVEAAANLPPVLSVEAGAAS